MTHDHADAILGLDDVRDVQIHRPSSPASPVTDDQLTFDIAAPSPHQTHKTLIDTSKSNFVGVAPRMPIHILDQHFAAIQRAFPYLCNPSKAASLVPNIDWKLFTSSMSIYGLYLPVINELHL
jgi:hypothetical protein